MTRFLWVEREWALRAGELTGLGDDIFLLTIDEVLGSACRVTTRQYELHPGPQRDLRPLPRAAALPDDHPRPLRPL